MRYFDIKIVLFSSFTLFSCSNTPTDNRISNDQPMILQFTDLGEKAVKLSHAANGLTKITNVIYLTPNKGTVIPASRDYCIFEDYIYLYNNESSEIMQFDHAGNFLGSLSGKGRGPGEFVQFANITANKYGLLILDGMAKKVLVYDHKTQLLIGEYPFEFTTSEVEGIPESKGFILYTPYKSQDSLIVLSREGLEATKAIKKNGCYSNISYSSKSVFSRFNQYVNFFDFISGTVYSLKSFDHYTARYVVKIEDQFPIEVCNETENYIVNNLNSGFKYNLLSEFKELENHIIVDFLNKDKGSNRIIVSKDSKNWICFDSDLLDKSFNFKLGFFPVVKVDDTHLATLIDYDYLYNVWKFDEDDVAISLKNLGENDNPVIIVFEYLPF